MSTPVLCPCVLAPASGADLPFFPGKREREHCYENAGANVDSKRRQVHCTILPHFGGCLTDSVLVFGIWFLVIRGVSITASFWLRFRRAVPLCARQIKTT